MTTNCECVWGELTNAERSLMVKIGKWDGSAFIGLRAKSRRSLIEKGLIEDYSVREKRSNVIFTHKGYEIFVNRHGVNTPALK